MTTRSTPPRSVIQPCSNASSRTCLCATSPHSSATSSPVAWPSLPVGQWQGPIQSGYGMHLVLVSARTDGRAPELDEVRDALRRDWLNERRIAANEAYYQSLLQRYTVTVEGRK